MRPGSARSLRLAALVAFVVALAITGAWLGHTGRLDTRAIAGAVARLGPWAVPAFCLTCVAGELLHLPGMLFVVAAQLAFGHALGLAVAYLGAVLGVTVAFAIARAARGRTAAPPARPLRWRWARRLLERLDQRPVSTIVLLRLVFWISPPLNYALGWSRVRARDYLIGSAAGLVVPVLLVGLVLTRLA